MEGLADRFKMENNRRTLLLLLVAASVGCGSLL
jgi:hypothetical protein